MRSPFFVFAMKSSAGKWLKAAVSLAAGLPGKVVDGPVTVLIPAAGLSSRMEGTDKLALTLGDAPVLVHTLRAFQRCSAVDEIILITRPEKIRSLVETVRAYGLRKVSTVTEGGETRLESVARGFSQISARKGLVAVHDGARPFVTPEDIEKVIRAARKYGAATAAVPATDTLKKCDKNGRILETVPRDGIWRMQTPQVFSYDLLRVALAYAEASGVQVTDDCGLMEACGIPVYVCPCGIHNIKITATEDLPVANALTEFQKTKGNE